MLILTCWVLCGCVIWPSLLFPFAPFLLPNSLSFCQDWMFATINCHLMMHCSRIRSSVSPPIYNISPSSSLLHCQTIIQRTSLWYIQTQSPSFNHHSCYIRYLILELDLLIIHTKFPYGIVHTHQMQTTFQ